MVAWFTALAFALVMLSEGYFTSKQGTKRLKGVFNITEKLKQNLVSGSWTPNLDTPLNLMLLRPILIIKIMANDWDFLLDLIQEYLLF